MGAGIRRLIGGRIRSAIAVDSESLKLVRVERNGSRFRLVSALYHEFDTGARREPDAIAETLAAEGLDDFRNERVVDLISGPSLFSKIVDLPRMPKSEAIAALAFTEKDTAPFPLSDARTDIWILGDGAERGRMKVMMAAIPQRELERRRARLEEAGMALSGVSTESAAIGALVLRSGALGGEGVRLLLHVGADYTGVDLFRGKELLYSREIRIGTGDFVDALTDEKVDRHAARAVLRIHGIPLEDSWTCEEIGAEEVTGRLSRSLERLETELARSIEYFRNTFHFAPIERAFLLGDGAGIRNLDARLANTLKAPVDVYDPLNDVVDADDGIRRELKDNQGALATVIGLAIDGGETLNLAPDKTGRSAIRGVVVRASLLAAAAVVVFLAAGVWNDVLARLDGRIAALRADVEILEARTVAFGRMRAELSTLDGRVNMIEKRIAAYPALRGAGYDWDSIFHEIAAALPANGALTSMAIDFTSGATEAKKKSAARSGSSNVRLAGVIRGSKRSRIAELNHLIERISSSALFESVTLGGTGRGAHENTTLMTFDIRARLPAASARVAAPVAGTPPGDS